MKKLHIPIYEQVIYLFDSFKDHDRWVQKYLGCDHEARDIVGAVDYYENEEGTIIVTLTVQDKDIFTVLHESIHAAWEVLGKAGVKVDSDNQEPLAYLSEYIAKGYLKAFKLLPVTVNDSQIHSES